MIRLNKYKKYNLAVLLLFIILYGVYFSTNFFFYKDYGVSLWLKNIYNKKAAYSNSIKKPKIIIIGGSNVLFSINAEEIEKKLKIPVVNAGSNAGLGIIYILDKAQNDFIKPGDTVLLSVEYNLFYEGAQTSDVLFKYILSFDRNYFKKLNLKEKWEGYFTINCKDFLKSVIMAQTVKKKGLQAVADVIYNPENLSKNGDQLMTNGQKIDDFTRKNTIIKDLKSHIDYNKESMKSLIIFLDWCKQNNVKVIYSYPTIPYHKEYADSKYEIERNDLNTFFAHKNIPVLNTKKIYFMSNNYFFDTGYHLNSKGREVKTAVIINELKRFINNGKSNKL